MTNIPFPLRSGKAPFTFAGEPTLVNLYPRAIGADNRSPVIFLAIPGQSTFSNVSDVPSRGALYVEELGYLYSLHLGTLYKVDSAGTKTAIAGLIPGSAPAIMDRGQGATPQVAIVSDASSYVLTGGTTLGLITTFPPECGQANSVTVMNRRAIYTHSNGKVSWSDVDAFGTIDPLAFATAELLPDSLVRGYVDNGEIYILAKRHVEIWSDNDDANLPFKPLGGAYIPEGCASAQSVVTFDNKVHWLSTKGTIVRAVQYTAERLSDHSVEDAIAAVSDKTTIKCYVDNDEGHSFLVVTCDSFTKAYDAATGQWADRKSYQRPDWRAWPYAHAFGKRIVGDKAGGTLRQLSNTVYAEVGDAISRQIIFPDVSAWPNALIFDEVNFDLLTGAGLGGVSSSTLGYDPQAMLDWSDDGGHTWSNERWESVGVEGRYLDGITFRRMGASGQRGRRLRLTMTDPVPSAFALADIRVRVANQATK